MCLFPSTCEFRCVVAFLMMALVACSGAAPNTTQDRAEGHADEVEVPMSRQTLTFQALGMTVHGTVTTPAGSGPFPVVVLVAGSGPTDRDWNNKLLPGTNGSGKLLAEALAQHGIATLRYDKRGTGLTGMPASVAWGHYVDELNAAVEAVADLSNIDPERVFIAGHSEGGAHALRAAANPARPLAGVILLSTAGRTLRDVVIWQIGNQLAAALPQEKRQPELDALTEALDTIAMGQYVDPASVGTLPGIQQFVAALEAPSSIHFARGLLLWDPAAAFDGFEAPVLVVSGAKDIQVDPELDARPLAESARAAGRDVTMVIAPSADHVLKVESTPREQLNSAAGLRYNADDRTLDAAVVTAIVDFVTSRPR